MARGSPVSIRGSLVKGGDEVCSCLVALSCLWLRWAAVAAAVAAVAEAVAAVAEAVAARTSCSSICTLPKHSCVPACIRQHTSAYAAAVLYVYVSIRQHTSAYVSIRQHT